MHAPVYLVYKHFMSNDRPCLTGVCTDVDHAVKLIKKDASNNGESFKEITPDRGEVKKFMCGEIKWGEYDYCYIEKIAMNTLLP
jgi:hypothetical protein